MRESLTYIVHIPSEVPVHDVPVHLSLFTHFLFPDPNTSESLRYSTQAEYNSNSGDDELEIIYTSKVTSSVGTSEQDRHRQVFPERAHVEVGRPISARIPRSSPSQLTLTPHPSESPQVVICWPRRACKPRAFAGLGPHRLEVIHTYVVQCKT